MLLPVKQKILLLILIGLCFANKIIGQSETFSFSHLTIEDGLSQSTIFKIHQDSQGYMWFGTTDGLNKYDGYNFEVYNFNPADSNSISGNSITSMYEDENGFLWIGTVEGRLNLFDRKTETFKHYILRDKIGTEEFQTIDYRKYPLSFARNVNETITSIIGLDNNYLLIGTWGNGLFLFNKLTGKIESFTNDSVADSTISSDMVTDLLLDKNGAVWIATFGGGLNRIANAERFVRNEERTFEHLSDTRDTNNCICDPDIITLYEDSKGNIWIGTFNEGVARIEAEQKGNTVGQIYSQKYSHSLANPNSLSDNNVMDIVEDKEGDIWIGTFGGGVNQYIYKDDSFSSLKHDPFNEKSLSDNDVLSLFVDRTGILWVGTHLGKGLSKMDRNSVKFGVFQRNRGNSNSLNDDIVWSVYEDEEEEKIFFGTYKGGLNVYDISQKSYSVYQSDFDDEKTISSNHVRVIRKDYRGNYWIGTYDGGLNLLLAAENEFIRFMPNPENPNSITGNQVQAIYIDADTLCWLGVIGGGLLNFSLPEYYETGNLNLTIFRHNKNDNYSISDDRVYSIYEDSFETLWVGTFGGGLNRFDKEKKRFYRYQADLTDSTTISDNKVLCMLEDSNYNFWIGTSGGGLNLLDRENGKFRRLSNKIGFDVQVIYAMLEDNKKDLWLSSDNGLIKFNYVQGNITGFDLKDGLQSMEFSGGAYHKSSDGKMYFGGINGINYFYPDSVRINSIEPQVVISRIKVFNDELKGEREEIILDYDQNFFTIEFSALDYTNPGDNQYAHYLEGLEKDWLYTDANLRMAYYTNLQPGEFIFHVKGANNEGIWNNSGKTLRVEILPPLWKTWWFILLSVLTIGGVVSYVIYLRVRHLLAIEKIKVRLAADLHDNVGAGLTEIAIMSELASVQIKNTPEQAIEQVSSISETARQLVDSMSDIVWFVNPNRDSLHDLVIRLKDSFGELLSSMNISFKTSNLDNIEDVKLPMEFRQNLYLIFKEGIHNCIKHSKCTKIILDVKLSGNNLELQLTDNGIGINQERMTCQGNGLNNIRGRAKAINGYIDIISNANQGTIIRFKGRITVRSKFSFSKNN